MKEDLGVLLAQDSHVSWGEKTWQCQSTDLAERCALISSKEHKCRSRGLEAKC